MNNLTGYWTGEFSGTNTGGLSLELKQSGESLSGTAKMSEPTLGTYEYTVQGQFSKSLSLDLTPFRQPSHLILGRIKVVGVVESDGSITGRWKSEIGTEGIFRAKRYQVKNLTDSLPASNSVFIVHGHEEAVKHAVARFLEKMGLHPIILQEQMNCGMTVLEKFEEFASRAGFAVVLLTPDDYGYAVGNEQLKRFRARQNVILELGYFAAKLGRGKVFVLTKGDLEFPSDILGLVYESMDKGEGWKMTLARELKASGFPVDLNKEIA